MRWAERGITPLRAFIVGLIVLVVATYFIFTKALPFQQHYQFNAVVKNSNLLQPGSPVRIGGVTVGKVESTGRYKRTNLAIVHMQLDDTSQEIHSDATIDIRPRLFLEGNFYVQLAPGTPSAPALADGGTIPVAHTTDPVQIDQVLDAFPGHIRSQLQTALHGLGVGFDTTPSAAQDSRLVKSIRGLTGAQALNRTFETSAGALKDSGMVAQSLNGPDGKALSRVISGFAKASTGLVNAQSDLGPLIDDFDRTLQATAAQQASLRALVALLGPTARHANVAFTALNKAFPSTEHFSDALSTGLTQLPATIDAAYPWLAQAKPLLSDNELGALLTELQPASSQLASLTNDELKFLPQIDLFDRCISDVFIPTGDIVVKDGKLTTGLKNYEEFWYAMTGEAGASEGSDGNGPFLRLWASGGKYSVETGKTNYDGEDDTAFGNLAAKPTATRPAYPNKVPPLQRAAACYKQGLPDVNGPASTGPADGSAPNAKAPALPNDPTLDLSK